MPTRSPELRPSPPRPNIQRRKDDFHSSSSGGQREDSKEGPLNTKKVTSSTRQSLKDLKKTLFGQLSPLDVLENLVKSHNLKEHPTVQQTLEGNSGRHEPEVWNSQQNYAVTKYPPLPGLVTVTIDLRRLFPGCILLPSLNNKH